MLEDSSQRKEILSKDGYLFIDGPEIMPAEGVLMEMQILLSDEQNFSSITARFDTDV